jgi:hypothetical protein
LAYNSSVINKNDHYQSSTKKLTHDCKNDDDCKHGSKAVCESHDDRVPHAVVVGRIVRGVGDQPTEAEAEGKENLSASLQPDQRICQLAPLKK